MQKNRISYSIPLYITINSMAVNQKNLSNAFDITTLADSSIKKLEKLGMNINELVKLVQDKVGYSPVMMN